jgi:hypothetical protein
MQSFTIGKNIFKVKCEFTGEGRSSVAFTFEDIEPEATPLGVSTYVEIN